VSRLPIDQLLAAYASGAALSDEERTAVEAFLEQSPAARDEVTAIGGLLDELRAAQPEPPAAREAVVRAVRIACAAPPPARGPLGWLRRRWTIALPAGLAAAAAAVLAVQLAARSNALEPPAPAPAPPAPIALPEAPPADDGVYLDGEAIVLGDLDDDATAAIDDALDRALIDLGDTDDLVDTEAAGDELGLDPGALGLLPADSLDWVDQLDDAAIDTLDRWLAEQPS
jgi:hypothetical protein